jgi:chromosome segregation ATPase
MKTILLQWLQLRNFKGIVDYHVDFDLKSTKIYGHNGTGKSTLCTAFYWLLTGKDEFDRKDYELKNTVRKELNSRPHEVSACFLVDGREITLKRVYLEDWVKTRGQSERTFKGHKTEYYYNGVACSTATEYQDKVNQIITADIIKLVTNPLYFNTLKPEDQRRGLLAIAGEITTEEIIASISEEGRDFSQLLTVINRGDKLEDYKKQLAAKRLDLKKKAVEFGPKIEELQRTMPEPLDWVGIQSQIDGYKAEYQRIDSLMADNQKALAEKQKGITQLRNDVFIRNSEIDRIRESILRDQQQKQNHGSGELTTLRNTITSLTRQAAQLQAEIEAKKMFVDGLIHDIATYDADIMRHRENWDEINGETFQFDTCACPNCAHPLPEGTILPAEFVSKSREELVKRFHEDVARRKEQEVKQSNRKKELKKQAEERVNAAYITIEELKNKLRTVRDELDKQTSELADAEMAIKNRPVIDVKAAVDALMNNNADVLNLRDEIAALEKQIQQQTAALGETPTYEAEKARKVHIQQQIDELNKQLGLKATIEKVEARIQQLQKEEQDTAQAIADIEREEFNLEAYSRAKMDILESRVNQMFDHVRFRLFEQQVNGGIADTCVCELNGVPYPTLNTGSKIWAGIDVINTLSRHFNICAPVFVDNRESTINIPATKSQVINLVVSESDHALRVETNQVKETLFA